MGGPHSVYPSSVDGHLGRLHFLALVNNMSMNVVYERLFETLLSILLFIQAEAALLDGVVILFLIFREPSTLFCMENISDKGLRSLQCTSVSQRGN